MANRPKDTFKPTADKIAFLNRGRGPDAPDVQNAIEKVWSEIRRKTPTTALYSVLDFGAVGDGVTDDREAIQSAIDNASNNGGGVVYFPPGTYFLTSRTTGKCLEMKPNIILKGSGMPATTLLLQPNAPDLTKIISIEDAENVALMDLGVNGQWDTSNGDGQIFGIFVTANTRNVIIERVRVYNTRGDNIQLWGGETHGCHDIIINQCVLDTTGRNNITLEHACNVFVKHTIMRNAASSCVNMAYIAAPPPEVSEDGFWGPVHIDNCLLENCDSNAYEADGTTTHFFTNSTVRNFGGSGVRMRAGRGIIAGNTFTGAIVDPDRTSRIISIEGDNQNLTVESNVIDLSNNRYRSGIYVARSSSGGIPDNINIHDNIIIGPGPDEEEISGYGMINHGGIDCSFERNHVEGFHRGMVVSVTHPNDMRLCLIANNTFLDCAVGIYYTTAVDSENRLIDLVMKSNIFKAVQWNLGTTPRFFEPDSTSVRPYWIIETIMLNEDVPLRLASGTEGSLQTHWIVDVKENGAKFFQVLSGYGPEGLITAPFGSVAFHAGTGLTWVKASATGNTGWIKGFQIVAATNTYKRYVLSVNTVNNEGTLVATEIT